MDLGDQVVELGLASGLENRLVKVEERVGGLAHRTRRGHCGRRSGRRSRSCCRRSGRGGSSGYGSGQSTVATRSCRSRGPVGIAPAQFVGAILPDQFVGTVLPVINSLRASGGSKRCRGQQHRHFVQFIHGSPLGGKGRSSAANQGRHSVTITKNVDQIVPYVTVARAPSRLSDRRTKALEPPNVALQLQSLAPKMPSPRRFVPIL